MSAEEIFIRTDLGAAFAKKDVFQKIIDMEGEEFRALESRRTIATEINGKRYFVKYHRGIPTAEILKNLLQLRMPIVSARNEFTALTQLKALGIAVPLIAAYGKRGWLPQTCESFIVTDDVGTQETLEDYTKDWQSKPPPFREKLAIIKEIAGISRLMHSNGICHRDYYICHFMMSGSAVQGKQEEQDEQQDVTASTMTLIDLHRALVKKNLGQRWVIKDIGSLYFSAMDIGLTQRDLLRFIRVYSGLSLKMVFNQQGSQLFWRDVLKRAHRLKSRHS